MGDPAGIGPEIAIEAWRRRGTENIPAFALYAAPELLRDRGLSDITTVAAPSEARTVFETALPLIELPLAHRAMPGQPDTANATAVIAAIDRAVTDVAAGVASAVVTNPISKATLYQSGFTAPGHTEYLGSLARRIFPDAEVHPVMMLCSESLRVVPVTIHVPLRDVSSLLTTEAILAAARVTAHALRRDFGIEAPRLAVTGLNPHAGESGAIGTEDRDVIMPAIEALRAEGISATGPHSADTLFHAAARNTYDAVIAMYHDQALIPLKTLAFDEGVNVTLGLPFVRTSPDHGTAFDIAGRGVANPSSLIAALRLAEAMSARRALAPAR
jgi:4-hydroxythreonine-4-phosphate dehydrogenase